MEFLRSTTDLGAKSRVHDGSQSTSWKFRSMKRTAASMSGTLRVGTLRLAMLSEIAARRDWIVEGFIGFSGPDNRGTDDMVQRRAMESNKKI